MNLYLSFAFMILQIIAIPMLIYFSNLKNDGRKADQSEEDYNKQIKRWQCAIITLQLMACICAMINVLLAKGII